MLHRTSLATAAILALAAAASAQLVPLYSFTQSAGVYTPITGGTVLGTGTGSAGAASLDDVTYSVTLPFTFNFNGVGHTTVQVQTNGHIGFGTLATNSYTPLSSTVANAGYAAAIAGDLQGGWCFLGSRTTGSPVITGVSNLGPVQVGDFLSGTGIPTGATVVSISGSDITMSANATSTGATTGINAVGPWTELRWEVLGTSPNQVFVAQWQNFKRFGSTAATTQHLNLNFQIRLHENGNVECVYGSCSPGVSTSTGTLQVGLRGATNVFATDVNNRLNVKGTSDWATSAPGTANTSGQLFNNAAPANVIPSGLDYLWTPPVGQLATNTTLGTGCGGAYNSAYQLFPNAAVASAALTGNSLQLINTGTGYVGTWLPGTAGALFVTPVAATVLATGDDGEVNVTPSAALPTPYGAQANLRVSGNGVIGFGNVALTFPGSNSFTPTAGGFLNGNLGGFYAWHDYNSAEVGSGPISSEEIGGFLYITYNGVENYSTPAALNPSTVQFQLELATGNCTIVWGTVDADTTSTFGSAHLVGVSAPGASLDSGSIDLTSGFVTVASDVPALALTATSRPKQEVAVSNNWNLDANNLPVGIGVDIIGLADPGITNLALFGLGQNGCQLRATLDITGAFLSGGLHSWSFPIPAGAPALNGIELFAQTAVLDFAINLANTLTTNGVKGTIGNL